MIIKNIKSGLKKILGIGLLAGSLLLPNRTNADDEWQIGTYTANPNISGSITHQIHMSGAEENFDNLDAAYTNAPQSPNNQELKLYTSPYGDELQDDYRPSDSQTAFHGKIKVRDDLGTGMTCTNYYKFVANLEDTNRTYWVNLNLSPEYTANGLPFTWSGFLSNNLRIDAPGVLNATNGAEIGTLDKISLETIVSSAGENGSITPAGTNYVVFGDSTNFIINANEGYVLDNVKTNGIDVADVRGLDSYNLQLDNISGNITIDSVFTRKITQTTNGIPFSWFDQYGLTNKTDAGELEDSDFDGFNNLQEYIADTNPTNSSSYFCINNISSGNSVDIEISPSSTSRIYSVDNCLDLVNGSWQEITNSVGNSSNLVFSFDTSSNSVGFYRARVGVKKD